MNTSTLVLPLLTGAVCCLFIGATGSLRAEPLQELFESELVYPQEKGELQVGVFPRFEKNSGTERWALTTGLEYGLSDAFQVEIEWLAYQHLANRDEKSNSGVGDLELGARYVWMNIAESHWHSSVGFELGIPTGDEEQDLGEGDTAYSPFFILASDFPQFHDMQLAVHAGTEFEDSEREDFVNLSTFLPLGAIILSAEYNWSEEAAYVTPGLSWAPAPALELGIGVPIGANRAADDYRVLIHIIYEFSD
jgi:hypothetical protein